MGNSACQCERTEPTRHELYLSRTPRNSQLLDDTPCDPEDSMQECDNPSRDLLDRQFLKTTVIASNNILLDNPSRKTNSLPILQMNTFTPPPSIFRIESTQISIGKDQSQGAPSIEGEQHLPIATTRQRRPSLQSRVPQNGAEIEENGSQKKEDFETASTILKQISGYILSEKNLFEPVRVNRQNFIRFRKQDVHKQYYFVEKLGQGSYGFVYKAVHRLTNEIRAVKSLKRTSISRQQQQRIMAQIDILRRLDHPNIIKIYQAYTFEDHYYIVTEYCGGGSLLRHLKEGKTYSLATIQTIMRKLFGALLYLHRLNIVHRDIKLENIVLVQPVASSSDLEGFDIRLIDFGLAKVMSGKRMRDREKIGTYTHMAPEVIEGVYTPKCDLWSTGIVLYILLTGTCPFKGKTKQTTFDNIRTEDLNFNGSQWRNIPLEAKDLASKLLRKKLNNRIGAEEAVKHSWIRRQTHPQAGTVFDKITKKFYDYYRGNNLVSVIESYLAFTTTTQQEIQQFSKMFSLLDTNGDGFIETAELAAAFTECGRSFVSSEVSYVLKKVDKNHSGKIDYSEFVTILSDRSKLFARKGLLQAFHYLDANSSGFLEKNELKEALKLTDCRELTLILAELDQNEDQRISRDEFIRYLQTNQYQ